MTSTFETFIVSTSSEAAFSAAVAVAQNPGTVHNPLLLYGQTGAGKTHLLYAIAHALHTQPIPTRTLIANLQDAIRSHTVHALEESLATNEALILDDFPFAPDHQHTREALFAMLQKLSRKRVQIVIACKELPSDVPEHAVVVEVGYPTGDARLEILRRQAAMRGLALSDDVLQSLADRCSGNPRELQAMITRIAAESLLQRNE
ncbi:MAG TPA: DnaA/Hda family protein [Thermoanaerobaculia bacterium]